MGVTRRSATRTPRAVLEPQVSIPEREVLWGGPERPGLVYIVEQLTVAIAEQGKQIAELANNLTGEDGAKVEIAKLRKDFEAFKKEAGGYLRAARNGVLALAGIGAITMLIVGRAAFLLVPHLN